MKILSFWERATATPDLAAASTADGSVLATYGAVDVASRRLLSILASGERPQPEAASALRLLAMGLVANLAQAHLEVATLGIGRGPIAVTRELALRSWGQLVCATAHRVGVVEGSFLLPAGLEDPTIRRVTSWALHSGCCVIVPEGSGIDALGRDLVSCQPTTALLPQSGLYALQLSPTFARALRAVRTILVPAEGRVNGSVAPNVQPIRFGGLGPTSACRAEPGQRAFSSFWERALLMPEHPAIHDETTGQRLTFGELAARAADLVDSVDALGWQSTPMVVSDPQDFVTTVAVLLAVQRRGWNWLGVPPTEDAASFAYAAGAETTSIVEGRAWVTQGRLGTPVGEDRDRGPASGGLIMQTSGTTRHGRLVVRRAMPADADESGACGAQIVDMMGVPSCGTHLVANELLHGSFRGLAMGALHHGNELVYVARDDIDRIAQRIAEGSITSIFLLPNALGALVDRFCDGRYELPAPSPLVAVVHGGERIDPTVKLAAIDVFGPVLTEIYSTTEGNGTSIDSESWLRHPGSVGWPLPGALVSIEPAEVCVGEPNEVGAIHLWTRRTEYLDGSPALEGWFRTGDYGYVDADSGALYLTGRDPERLALGGMLLSGRHIASLLEQHPAVREAAVSLADDDGVQRMVAYVTVRDDLDPDALRRDLQEKLTPAAVPHRIIQVATLPRLGSGKVDWSTLRELPLPPVGSG